jgi:tetratricopeptide (TPR) repeat protein
MLEKYCAVLEKTAAPTQAQWQLLERLDEVLRVQSEQSALRRHAVRLAMAFHQYAEARHHLEMLLVADPENAELEQLLARCLATLGAYEQASAMLENSTRHEPHRIDTYVLWAEILSNRLGRPGEAKRVMNQLVKQNGQMFEAHLTRAQYHASSNGLDAAAADIARALELAPHNSEVLLLAAEIAERKGKCEDARMYLQRALENGSHHPQLYIALARLDQNGGGEAASERWLRTGLDHCPNDQSLRFLLGEILIQQGRRSQANEVASLLRLADGWSPYANYLEARILIGDKQWLKATKLLENARAALSTSPIVEVNLEVLLAQCHEQLGNRVEQLLAASRAVDADPSSSLARYSLGCALLASGELDKASTELRHSSVLGHPPQDVWRSLAECLLLANLRLPKEKQDWKETETILERAAKLDSGSIQVAVLRANLLAAQNQAKQAETLLQQMRQAHPESLDLRIGLAHLADSAGEHGRAAQILSDARQQFGAQPSLVLARLRHFRLEASGGAWADFAAIERDIGQLASEAQGACLRVLAESALDLGNFREAERVGKRIAQERPSDLHARQFLFDLALRTNNDSLLRDMVKELRSVEGEEGALWRLAKAAHGIALAKLGDQSALSQARTELAEAMRLRPELSYGHVLTAELAELDGNCEKAVESYLKGISLGERGPRVLERTARLLHERRRYREADQVIRKMPEMKDPTPEQAWLAADIAFHNRDFERSARLARRAVPIDSDDLRSLSWLAQVLAAGGQRVEAESILRRAIDRSPKLPDAWITLVRLLVRADQSEKVLATVEEAAGKLPADLVPFLLARCHEELGQTEKAARRYREALMKCPKNRDMLLYAANFCYRQDRAEDAEALLRQVVAMEGSVNETCHARRRLARALSAQDSPQKRQEALSLVRTNIQALGDRTEDARLLAIIRGKDGESRRPAIADIVTSTQKAPLSPEDQLSLAELYLADGDRPRFHELMLDLLAGHNDNAWVLAFYIRALLRQGEAVEASRWLSRLEKREPHGLRTTQLQLQLAELKRAKLKPTKSATSVTSPG